MVLQLQGRVDLGVIAMKEYSKFLQSFKTEISQSDSLVSYPGYLMSGVGVLPLWRDAVGVFYGPN